MQQENREYSRHQELYQKRISFLRDAARFVEQKRKIKSECRASPSELKHIIMRLKQKQTDVDDVKGKNEHLRHMIDDMLYRSQSQAELPFISLTNIEGQVNTMRSKEMKMEGSLVSGLPCHVTGAKASIIKASEIKNDDLTIKDSVGLIYNVTEKSRKMLNGTNLEETQSIFSKPPKQYDAVQGALEHVSKFGDSNSSTVEHENNEQIESSSLVEEDFKGQHEETQSICTELKFSEPPTRYDAVQGASEHVWKFGDRNSSTIEHENDEHLLSSSLVEEHFKGKHVEDIFRSSKEKIEEFAKHQIRSLQQQKSKMRNASEDIAVCSGALANGSDAEDKAIVKRSRAALSVIPFEEKLKILNNIYKVIIEWDGIWHHSNDRVWSPRLVFSTLEAAKMGKDRVKEFLGSKDGSLPLLICYEAICELIFSFPVENLLPTPFVREYLLVFGTSRLLKQVQNNTLMSFQDGESALFWGTLIGHAIYLATSDPATVTQIASIFSGILLPISRFKDLSKEEYEVARLNLNTFITHLIADKVEEASVSYEQDCLEDVDELISLNKNEDKRNGLVPTVEEVEIAVNGKAFNESKPLFISQDKMSSCISCRLILQILFCKRSK